MTPQSDGTWSLPQTVHNRRLGFSAVAPVTRSMTELMGIPVSALRCLSQTVDEEAQRYRGLFTLENHSLTQEPPLDGRWVDQRELAGLTFSDESDRPLIERYLEETGRLALPDERRSWQRPDWHAAAHQWIESTLANADYTLTGPIEQYDSWGLTCLMTVATDRGTVFFKTAPNLPLFAHEPRVMDGLARLFPGQIPKPMAIEPAERWMLLADFGSTYDDRAPEEVDDAQAEIMGRFGELQIDAIPHVQDLLSLGCLDRRLNHLMADADELLADDRIMDCFESDEVRRLRECSPTLRARCEKLQEYDIPETLIHGDLGMGNVAGEAGASLFFDWTEAAIGFPFFDIFDMFFAEDLGKQVRVRDAYMAAWQPYETRPCLLETWAIARPLCALYHTISYRNIFIHLESPYREAMRDFVRLWGRRILEYIQSER